MPQQVSVRGARPITTIGYSNAAPSLQDTDWTTVVLNPFGGYLTVYNRSTTRSLYVAFPAIVGGVAGVSAEFGTCEDNRCVEVPAGGWRTFPLGRPAKGERYATECSLWGGEGASHPWDAVQHEYL